MDSRAPPHGPRSHTPPLRQRIPTRRRRLPNAPPLADSSALHQSQCWIHGGLLDLVPSSAWSPAGGPPPRQDAVHLGPVGASRRGSPMLRL
ncbi:hypothetical protein CFC21_061669 [Triticum aestivum]|uniref:Uncharacterized protein n=2 Tax=Triticum aestivum TaxID=4565 RepID=A0A9R1GU82_WHEAT|nr:hypothetical protein CFC21_061669 [Triticum aestivum]